MTSNSYILRTRKWSYESNPNLTERLSVLRFYGKCKKETLRLEQIEQIHQKL